jgi:hypothetical protein
MIMLIIHALNSEAYVQTLPIHKSCVVEKITQEGQLKNMRRTTLHKSSPCTSYSCLVRDPTNMHINNTILYPVTTNPSNSNKE